MNSKVAKQIRKVAPLVQAKIGADILAKGGDISMIPPVEYIEKQLKKQYKRGALPHEDIRVRCGDLPAQQGGDGDRELQGGPVAPGQLDGVVRGEVVEGRSDGTTEDTDLPVPG